jgi:hypothetical protein
MYKRVNHRHQRQGEPHERELYRRLLAKLFRTYTRAKSSKFSRRPPFQKIALSDREAVERVMKRMVRRHYEYQKDAPASGRGRYTIGHVSLPPDARELAFRAQDEINWRDRNAKIEYGLRKKAYSLAYAQHQFGYNAPQQQGGGQEMMGQQAAPMERDPVAPSLPFAVPENVLFKNEREGEAPGDEYINAQRIRNS